MVWCGPGPIRVSYTSNKLFYFYLLTNLKNAEDFKNLAVKYAKDKKLLAGLKQKLAANIKSSALFHTENYVKNLEEKFLQAVG